jgi:hypothetical protein
LIGDDEGCLSSWFGRRAQQQKQHEKKKYKQKRRRRMEKNSISPHWKNLTKEVAALTKEMEEEKPRVFLKNF